MVKSIGSWLWRTNPLWLVGVAMAVQAAWMHDVALLAPAGLVMFLSYIQNATYGLQSRAANRNNNAYHFMAAVAASLVFFTNLQLLARKEMPLVLFAPYVFATILGSLHGNAISMRIEKLLNIRVGDPKDKPQLMKLWPSVTVLAVLAVGQMLFLAPSYGSGVLALLVLLALVDGFAFAILRLARSTDHYWFHGATVLLQIGTAFLRLAIMINLKMDWALFWPVTTGGVIGGLLGANYGHRVATRIKAGFDAHVKPGAKVATPTPQLTLLALGLLAHALYFGLTNWQPALFLLGFAFAQTVSFTMVSRARQRKDQQFLAWTSVFSNGVWYLTMHELVIGRIGWDKAAPYIVGCCAGSLIGQTVAMMVEQRLGAVMDAGTAKVVPQPVPKPETA